MRCLACDCLLSDREATRRSIVTDEFLDLCDHCFSTVADVLGAYDRPEYADGPYDGDENQED